MGIVPIYVWNHLPSADNRDGLVARSEQPVLPEVMEKRKMQFQRLQDARPIPPRETDHDSFVFLKPCIAQQARDTSSRQH